MVIFKYLNLQDLWKLNNYFANITKTLKLKKYPNFDGQSLSAITEYFKNSA